MDNRLDVNINGVAKDFEIDENGTLIIKELDITGFGLEYTDMFNQKLISKSEFTGDYDVCKHCSNNPKNGGSGICHCILGSPKIVGGI